MGLNKMEELQGDNNLWGNPQGYCNKYKSY